MVNRLREHFGEDTPLKAIDGPAVQAFKDTYQPSESHATTGGHVAVNRMLCAPITTT